MYEINLNDVQEYMIGYNIVSKIYEIRDEFLFNEDKIEYNELIIGHKTLDYISEINFTFTKNVYKIEDIEEVSKVGNLLNFEVYLDPYHDNIITMMQKGKNKIEIKIIF